MARNKHPERTVELILDTAQRLFVEIGYEKTSMQNIMDETGLSKGRSTITLSRRRKFSMWWQNESVRRM